MKISVKAQLSTSAEDLLSKVNLSPTKICHLYSEGHCQFGDRCKFLHSGVPGVILKQQFAGDSASGTNPRKVALRHSDETSNRVRTVRLSGMDIWRSKKHYIELTKSLDELYSNGVDGNFTFHSEDLQYTDKLGKGGFAVVYKANFLTKNSSMPSEVAVKQLFVELWEASSPENRANNAKFFCREVLNLRKASNHPNIVKILGICSDIPNVCIILEYMRSGSLHDIIHQQKVRLDGRNVIRVALNVSDGMEYLHSLNIIHRDLHCGNVLVDGENIKITDFGLSMAIPENTRSNLTEGIAHARYGAPELFRDDVYGKEADVYQYGVLIYEIFTGQIYFSDRPILSIAYAVGSGLRPSLPKRENLYVSSNGSNNTPSEIEELITEKEYRILYDLITQSWTGTISDRPTFSKISCTLSMANKM